MSKTEGVIQKRYKKVTFKKMSQKQLEFFNDFINETRKEHPETSEYERVISNEILDYVKLDFFYKLELKYLFSIFLKIDFNEIDVAYFVIKTFLEKLIKFHGNEKEVLNILLILPISQDSFNYDECISLLSIFRNIPLFSTICKHYLYEKSLVSEDKDFQINELQTKIKQLENHIKELLPYKYPEKFNTPRNLASDIFKASSFGSLSNVRYYIEEKGVDKNSISSFSKESPLFLACDINDKNHYDVVEYLVEMQNADVNITTKDGETPLHRACKRENLRIVKFLHMHNANTDLKDINGETPLHYACEYNSNIDVVKYLIEEQKCNKNAIDNNGRNALHFACRGGNFNIVIYLIENQHFDIGMKDNFEMAPLDYSKRNLEYIIKLEDESDDDDDDDEHKIDEKESLILSPSIEELEDNEYKKEEYNKIIKYLNDLSHK